MTLAFLNIGTTEMIFILAIGLGLIIAVANYGRNTALGYWGTLLLAIFSSPIVAFVVAAVLRSKGKKQLVN